MSRIEPIPRLIIFGGLPGSGKSTLARHLAEYIGTTYLRIDSIEQAIKNSSTKNITEVIDEGYLVGYAVAKDNLSIGNSVVADSVNPIAITRKAWLNVAHNIKCKIQEIEVICSHKKEHKKRVETRATDILGLELPDWHKVINREYEQWQGHHILIDTYGKSAPETLQELYKKLGLQ